jgi:hypothetical protein
MINVTGTGSTRTTIRPADIRTSAHSDEGMEDFRRCSDERSRSHRFRVEEILRQPAVNRHGQSNDDLTP